MLSFLCLFIVSLSAFFGVFLDLRLIEIHKMRLIAAQNIDIATVYHFQCVWKYRMQYFKTETKRAHRNNERRSADFNSGTIEIVLLQFNKHFCAVVTNACDSPTNELLNYWSNWWLQYNDKRNTHHHFTSNCQFSFVLAVTMIKL